MIYIGKIEKNNIQYGKVKVRIYGLNTENKSELPTTDLYDAYILYPAESNIDGQSNFRTIQNGTKVIVSFLDNEKQVPIILGSIQSLIDKLPDFTKGFTDENGQHPSSEYLNESTISRLARNEKIDQTSVQEKINNRQTGITCVNQSFDEPANQYNAVYPNNRVLETRKHIIEIDDTDGAERINIYHSSGTFEEVNPDGTKIEKIKAKKFLSVSDDYNIIVSGNVNLKSDSDINMEGTNINMKASTINIEGGQIDVTGPTIFNNTVNILQLLTTAGISNTGGLVDDNIDVGKDHTHFYTWTDPGGSGNTSGVNS